MGQAEKEQIKQEVIAFDKDVQEMKVKVKHAVKKLRSIADELDKVWRDCKKKSAAGSSLGIMGSALSLFGSITTAGLATPMLIAGTVFGVTGAYTKLEANYIESCTNLSLLPEADEAVQIAYRAMDKVRGKLRMFKNGKSAAQLVFLFDIAAKILGHNDLAAGLIKDLLSPLLRKILGDSAAGAISQVARKLGDVTTSVVSKVGTKVGADRAGAFVAGVSAVFLILDTVELSFTVRDIVKNEGSNSARCLRYRADELEELHSA